MRTCLILLPLCFSLPATPAAARAILAVQDDAAPIADKRPEVAELIAKLEADVAKNTPAGDTDAVADIDQLLIQFPKSGPKDRASITKALSKCFDAKRREGEGGVPNNKMHIAAAHVLGMMGPESVKPLIGWIGHKDFKKDVAVQRELILALGKTREKEGIKPLTGMLQNKDATLISASATALGSYATSDVAIRKEVFEDLLKVLMSAKGQVDADVNDTIARERYDVIKASIMTSLGQLSGHSEQEPEEFQRWWNKNKKADWAAAQ